MSSSSLVNCQWTFFWVNTKQPPCEWMRKLVRATHSGGTLDSEYNLWSNTFGGAIDLSFYFCRSHFFLCCHLKHLLTLCAMIKDWDSSKGRYWTLIWQGSVKRCCHGDRRSLNKASLMLLCSCRKTVNYKWERYFPLRICSCVCNDYFLSLIALVSAGRSLNDTWTLIHTAMSPIMLLDLVFRARPAEDSHWSSYPLW